MICRAARHFINVCATQVVVSTDGQTDKHDDTDDALTLTQTSPHMHAAQKNGAPDQTFLHLYILKILK